MRSVLTRDKPELKRIKTSHRKVSRLDLFFDLMYVLLIRDLFHMMVGEVTLELFWKIALIFIPVWLIRQGYNFYIQRFEETTVRHRMLTFLLMACVGAYSFSVHEFGLEITPLLLGSTMMGHGVIAYMFLSAVWGVPETSGRIPKVIAGSHLVFFALRAIGFYIPGELFFRTVLPLSIVIALICSLSFPFISKKMPSIHSGHLSERFGLFILIVLAELIYGLVLGLSEAYFITTKQIILAVMGFLCTIAIWWSYFDVIGHNPVKKSALRYVSYWTMLHLPLSLAIIFLGGMFLHLISQTSTSMMTSTLVSVTGAMFASLLLIMGCMSFFHKFEYTEKKYNLGWTEHLPGIIMIGEMIFFLLFLLVVQPTDPIVLISIVLVGYIINMTLFHMYLDPLAEEEEYL